MVTVIIFGTLILLALLDTPTNGEDPSVQYEFRNIVVTYDLRDPYGSDPPYGRSLEKPILDAITLDVMISDAETKMQTLVTQIEDILTATSATPPKMLYSLRGAGIRKEQGNWIRIVEWNVGDNEADPLHPFVLGIVSLIDGTDVRPGFRIREHFSIGTEEYGSLMRTKRLEMETTLSLNTNFVSTISREQMLDSANVLEKNLNKYAMQHGDVRIQLTNSRVIYFSHFDSIISAKAIASRGNSHFEANLYWRIPLSTFESIQIVVTLMEID